MSAHPRARAAASCDGSLARLTESAWREAAVFGALWGSLEITLGAFLHTLRVPLTGLLLTACGVALLVAGREVFPRRGFAIRAGLVCACIKALSPGGIILAPMVGIAVEATLVELSFLVLRAHLPAAAVGGALAATWAVAQYPLQLLVLYGATFLELNLALLDRAARFLTIDPAWGAPLLALFGAVVAAIGVGGGLVGLSIGREVSQRLGSGPGRRAP